MLFEKADLLTLGRPEAQGFLVPGAAGGGTSEPSLPKPPGENPPGRSHGDFAERPHPTQSPRRGPDMALRGAEKGGQQCGLRESLSTFTAEPKTTSHRPQG